MRMEKFTEIFTKIAAKISTNKYLVAIRDGLMALMPMLIVGSIGTLLGSVVFSTNGLAQIKGLEFLQNYSQVFLKLANSTTDILALLAAFSIGRAYAKNFKSEGFLEGVLAVVCFLIVSPNTLNVVVDDKSQVVAGVLSTNVINSRGLFVAMIASVACVAAYSHLVKIDKLKIKLPDSVPPNVAGAFTVIIPTSIVCIATTLFAAIFEGLVGSNMADFIYSVLQAPIQAAFQHPLGILIVVFFAGLFWFLGVHGSSLAMTIVGPIMYASLQVNMSAFANGQPVTEIVTYPFWNLFATMGGFGCTLGLIAAIFIVGKKEEDKAIAKLSLPAGIFGINEPMIFGLPIVMNPIIAIPFILTPIVTCIIGYLAMYLGICSKFVSAVPWVVPPCLNGFIATGGDIRMALVQAVCLVVSTLIYIPFVKIRNNVDK